MYSVSNKIRNILKLDTKNSFFLAQDLNTLPNKKYDRVLYFFREEDNEEEVTKKLIALCSPSGLILCRNVPEINKRLSNGHLKENKEVFTELMNKEDIKRFWFLPTKREYLFDFLLETK